MFLSFPVSSVAQGEEICSTLLAHGVESDIVENDGTLHVISDDLFEEEIDEICSSLPA